MYGVLVCNLSEQLFDNGEFLVNQMGSAVKMIDLLKTKEMISKSDPLTGILNRRGFYIEAEQKMQEIHRDRKKLLLVYIDMNNLKIINDQFGHEEGDFSLKLIGKFLKELTKENGIAGRIGGDEYACALTYNVEDEGALFAGKVYETFAKFNQASSKDYNVTVSIGMYEMPWDSELTLEDALARADENLYEAKKYKPDSVFK